MNQALQHHFKRFRQHQRETDGGGAWPGEHAISAINSARQHIRFTKQLKKDVADHKRRSAAAKRAWRKRKQDVT